MKIVIIIGRVSCCLLLLSEFLSSPLNPKSIPISMFTQTCAPTLSRRYWNNRNERPITQDFTEFTLAVSFPFNKVFGSDVIAVPLQSFESDTLGVATISQFEVPPDSSYYRDFTFT